MNIYYEAAAGLPFYRELSSAVDQGQLPASVSGLGAVHKAHIAMLLSLKRNVLVLCPDEASASRLAEDINELHGGSIACLFPSKDLVFASSVETASREYEQRRIGALMGLTLGSYRILTASAEAAMQSCIPKEALLSRCFTVSPGDSVDTSLLTDRLVEAGYVKSPVTEGRGQFSVRGSIIDIFPAGGEMPVRIELWGDEVDTVSTYDPETQRRFDTIKKAVFPPCCELGISCEELSKRLERLIGGLTGRSQEKARQNLQRELDSIRQGILPSSLDKYYSVIYGSPANLTDYFEDGLLIISEHSDCRERAASVEAQLKEDLKLLYEDGILCPGLDGFFVEYSPLLARASRLDTVYLDSFPRGSLRLKRLIAAEAFSSSSWSGDWATLDDELRSLISRGYCTVVLVGGSKSAGILVSDLEKSGYRASLLSDSSPLAPGTVLVGSGSLSGGLDYPSAKFAVITQRKTVSGRKKRPQKKQSNAERIHSLSDISTGDLVVHALHGIGRFGGISTITTSGVTKDYITIKYAGSDVLYVPVTQLDTVSRYIGPRDDENVKLNRLGTSEWTRTRARVKSACKDMADELIALYAKRQLAKGFAFSEDDSFQTEFEERFEYQETDDQLQSIQEIKADMQRPVPMDRLLCGDVGFGKTEVALRAAMKCVLSGKQCAVMVPTTVLAWQHYQTALRRFEHFPIKIELLSRFRSQKEQKNIVARLKSGDVELVIGTHRLVQGDIAFKDLGLLIIDEEQRFGVAHKEKLKELYPSVDILTLSATPIPRTLNMAMSGIRDMSVLEEPPSDRYPVQTYVIEHQHGIVVQAIQKELRRGGQVYYIHNRIETLSGCAFKLSQSLPDARIGVAHGQMPENELSEIWRQLIEHEIDILVCTTIIETGVDVPNVNTLIIEDADRFGLSQLYQLRGRVGRSSRRAYAYFTFRRGKVLSEIAAKRLSAIRELTQFGSGFKIAIRDLEIRGVGSILSARQHGHMEAVGYDMYLKLLEEAIAENRGEPVKKEDSDCVIDITVNAYIPNDYIEDTNSRLEAYRKIAAIKTPCDREDVLDELIDRYGDPPKSAVGLTDVALMRSQASRLGIKEISQKGSSVTFYIRSLFSVDGIMRLTQAYRDRILVNGSENGYFSIRLAKSQPPAELVKAVLRTMDEQ